MLINAPSRTTFELILVASTVCRLLKSLSLVPLNIERSNIFKILEKMGNDSPCYMCARLGRGALYQMAQDKGCNKLALGHHFDDVIETTMMNILYAAPICLA